MESQGFFASIPPVEGAIATLKELSTTDGWEIFFVTSPFTSPHCIPEKLQWILKHFGDKKWQDRVIFTKDKTMIRGEGGVLIDDNPNIDELKGKSLLVPTWRHVLFSRKYNEERKEKPRLTSWQIDHVRKVLGDVQ